MCTLAQIRAPTPPTKQKSNRAAMEQRILPCRIMPSPRPKLCTAWPSQIRFQETHPPNPSSGSHEPRANRAAFHPLHLDEIAPGREISAAAPALRSKRRRNAPESCGELGAAPPGARSEGWGLGEGGRDSPETDGRAAGEGGGGGWCRGTPLTLAQCCAAQSAFSQRGMCGLERRIGAVLRITPVAVWGLFEKWAGVYAWYSV
jgi:hypothetical protein